MFLIDKFLSNLVKCTNTLPRWSRGMMLVNERTIKDKYDTLQKLSKVEDSHNVEKIKIVQKDIDNTLEEEDMKWR